MRFKEWLTSDEFSSSEKVYDDHSTVDGRWTQEINVKTHKHFQPRTRKVVAESKFLFPKINNFFLLLLLFLLLIDDLKSKHLIFAFRKIKSICIPLPHLFVNFLLKFPSIPDLTTSETGFYHISWQCFWIPTACLSLPRNFKTFMFFCYFFIYCR